MIEPPERISGSGEVGSLEGVGDREIEFFLRHVFEQVWLRPAGIGKDDVDATVLFLDMVAKRVNISDPGNIAADGVNAVADALRGSIERRLIAAGDHEFCPFACKELGCRQSHSRVAAGDDSEFSVQFTHIRLQFFSERPRHDVHDCWSSGAGSYI